MKKTAFILLIVSAFLACDGDNPFAPELAVNLVTGINFSDINGTALGKKGNPNVKTEGVFVFPNPVFSGPEVYVLAQQAITTIWLVEGIAQKTSSNTDMESLLENHEYTPEDIKAFPALEFTPNDSSFVIHTDMIEKGYYRLFLQLADGNIVWDNLFLNPGKSFEETWDELTEFWD